MPGGMINLKVSNSIVSELVLEMLAEIFNRNTDSLFEVINDATIDSPEFFVPKDFNHLKFCPRASARKKTKIRKM
jgi:hypothetical protein